MNSSLWAAEQRWCAPCGTQTVFEVPPCQDGHGLDCPDLACVECGSALVIGAVLAPEAPRSSLLDAA